MDTKWMDMRRFGCAELMREGVAMSEMDGFDRVWICELLVAMDAGMSVTMNRWIDGWLNGWMVWVNEQQEMYKSMNGMNTQPVQDPVQIRELYI